MTALDAKSRQRALHKWIQVQADEDVAPGLDGIVKRKQLHREVLRLDRAGNRIGCIRSRNDRQTGAEDQQEEVTEQSGLAKPRHRKAQRFLLYIVAARR